LKRLSHIRTSLALGVALAMIARTSFAQSPGQPVRGAPVKIVDQPGRAPYQHSVKFNGAGTVCRAGNDCRLPFPVVPSGKRLVLEHVTAVVWLSVSAIVCTDSGLTERPNFISLITNDGPFLTDSTFIIKPDFKAACDSPFWVMDRPVRAYVEGGQTPTIWIRAIGQMDRSNSMVSLHGYLMDANN
jgi:hypothetical protein